MKLFYSFFTLSVQSTVLSIPCEVHFSVLFHSHFESPPRCSLFLEALHPLPPAGTLIPCGTASNPPPRRLGHSTRAVTVALRGFLSRRCAYVCLPWHPHRFEHMWSSQEINNGFLNKKLRYKILLFMYANTDFFQ